MKLSEAVALYIRLRDKKAEIKAETDAKLAPINEKMERLEAKLLAAFETQGVDSVKTENGTAYQSTRTSASIAEPDAFMAHVKETLSWDMLEKRVNKGAVEAYLAEHGQLPPGINLRTERVVNVRRSS